MTNGFTEIKDIESLTQFLAAPTGDPAIIFKHSNTCGISARAYTQMTGFGRSVGIVIVQNARAVSDEIERRSGVPHETPQLLIFRNGEVIWTASHGQIRGEAVAAVLEEIGKGTMVPEARP